jgi:cobalamin biosynthesis protein CobT
MKRKEKRHILMVFSDGQPACPGDNAALRAHLKNSVAMIEKAGVDVIGIGIQTKAVENYYSKHVVLNDVDQLAGEVMQQLRKFLLN